MTIQYCSDLHLEFHDNELFLHAFPIIPSAEILILAGDIVPFYKMHHFEKFFDKLAVQFKKVYWLPGNHEYYQGNVAMDRGTRHDQIRKNIFIVNNYTVETSNKRIIFSTLWSKISPEKQQFVSTRVSDFFEISYNESSFTPHHFNALHNDCLTYLTNQLETPSTHQTIVVTHHVPTFKNYPSEYEGSMLSEIFTVELKELILRFKPAYWIYGHHHSNVPDFMIGQTRLCTNQLGYVKYREYKGYKRDKVLAN